MTALALSGLTNALKFPSSSPVVDLRGVRYKSCLKQAELDGSPKPSAKAVC